MRAKFYMQVLDSFCSRCVIMVKVKIKARDFESRLFQGQVQSCLKVPLVTSRKGIILLYVSFWLVTARKFCFHGGQNRPQFEQFFKDIIVWVKLLIIVEMEKFAQQNKAVFIHVLGKKWAI